MHWEGWGEYNKKAHKIYKRPPTSGIRMNFVSPVKKRKLHLDRISLLINFKIRSSCVV